jgi:hypothetical protein
MRQKKKQHLWGQNAETKEKRHTSRENGLPGAPNGRGRLAFRCILPEPDGKPFITAIQPSNTLI